MLIRRIALALALIGASPACADTITLDQTYRPEKFKGLDRKIDPDASVYGVPFGSTEEQVIAAFGPPRGAILLGDHLKLFLYGKAHSFIFRSGKFVELSVSRYSYLGFEISHRLERHPFFDSDRLEVGPGLRFGMKFDQIASALKEPDLVPDHRVTIDGTHSTMTLNFSSTMGMSGPSAYELNGFSIKHHGG